MHRIWERRGAFLMKNPSRSRGAGAFRSRDGDSTRHLRYEPSRLQLLHVQLLHGRLGRETDAG